MSNWRANDASPPSAPWIAKPIGVDSYVWRLIPVLKREPSWSTFFASGSSSVSFVSHVPSSLNVSQTWNDVCPT